jgi:four helix bundle protein
MEIFEISKTFPKEERYSLTDQIRRSSRSVAVCVAEAYRKRSYQPYFRSKTSDADMENSETLVWLEFAEKCQYISDEIRQTLEEKAFEVGKLLNHMMVYPEKYVRKEKS